MRIGNFFIKKHKMIKIYRFNDLKLYHKVVKYLCMQKNCGIIISCEYAGNFILLVFAALKRGKLTKEK